MYSKSFSIKEVARTTGLSASNIRYYEKQGLIAGVKRDSANVRRFSEIDINWIAFLARLKDMEMPIEMMKRYAELRAEGDCTIQERMTLLAAHRNHMLEKIEHIRNNIALLDGKIEIYREMEQKNHGK